MTRTRLTSLVLAMLAYAILGTGTGCRFNAKGWYRLQEETRVFSIDTGGEIRGHAHQTRDVLLPRVPVPPQEGEREVQETPAATPERQDVRGDDAASQEGARVDARAAGVDARPAFPACYTPKVMLVPVPGPGLLRVLDCNESGTCQECAIGAYSSAVRSALADLESRVIPAGRM